MIQLPNSSVWSWRRRRKKSKTGKDGSHQTVQAGHGEGQRKKSKTAEDGSYHTAQVGPGEKKKNGFDLDLIWMEIGFFIICSPCNGNHFSSSYTMGSRDIS